MCSEVDKIIMPQTKHNVSEWIPDRQVENDVVFSPFFILWIYFPQHPLFAQWQEGFLWLHPAIVQLP